MRNAILFKMTSDGVSVSELSESVGFSKPTIRNAVQNPGSAKFETLLRICDRLGLEFGIPKSGKIERR